MGAALLLAAQLVQDGSSSFVGCAAGAGWEQSVVFGCAACRMGQTSAGVGGYPPSEVLQPGGTAVEANVHREQQQQLQQWLSGARVAYTAGDFAQSWKLAQAVSRAGVPLLLPASTCCLGGGSVRALGMLGAWERLGS